MQVLSIPVNNYQLLLPISMVAQIIGKVAIADPKSVSASAAAKGGEVSHRCLYGMVKWKEYDLPLIRSSELIGQSRKADESYERMVILWPMKSATNRAFIGLTSLGAPRVVDITEQPFANINADLSYSLGVVQLDGSLGVVPDIDRLSSELFVPGEPSSQHASPD